MPENESCSKVLNFLERLDDTVRCCQAVRGYIYIYEFGPRAERNIVDFCCSLVYRVWELFHVMGPSWRNVRWPWNVFFRFGILNVRVLADKRNERDAMYR